MLYTSEKTNKSYKTVEELEVAEKEFDKAEAEKKALTEVKKSRAEEVQKAYEEYLQIKNDCFKQIREAEQKYVDLRNKFAEDYNGYHYTYINDNGKEIISFGDLLESFFKPF